MYIIPYFCPRCYAEWKKEFDSCNHQWKPHVDVHGDDCRICEKCSGIEHDEEASAPIPQAPGEEGLRERIALLLDKTYPKVAAKIRAGMHSSNWPEDLIDPGLLWDAARLSPSPDLVAAATVPPDDPRTPYGHCVGRTPFERTIEHICTYLPNPHEGTDCRDAAADAVFQGMIGEVLAFAMRGVVRITALRSAGGE